MTLESTSDYWRIWFYLFEAAGLDVQLVNASQARHLPGRPKTDKLDAMWLARLTEKGMLRPSFVPPAEIRALRHYTRTRTHLVQDRTRCWQRMEKLLEDALIKVSSVASKLTTASARDMIEALIAGERDPQVLAGLARGRMKARHDALVAALDGRFDDHHAELARSCSTRSTSWTSRSPGSTILISEQLACDPRTPGASTPTASPAPPPARASDAVGAARRRPARRDPRHQPRARRRRSSPRPAWT